MRPAQLLSVAALLGVLAAAAPAARAHCQVPCGIYDDHARVHAMLEDVTTIDKAARAVGRLAGKTDAQSLNQATRWIATKELHATRIITTVAEYFLTQKIKPADPKDKEAFQAYVAKLADHHAVMVAAMKAKQSVEVARVTALREAVQKLERYWRPKP